MIRFAIKDYGKADEVFEAIEAKPREMSPKHVRVALKAFGVNPYDVGLRQGEMQSFRQLNFPYVLGNDGAGVVIEAGAEAAELKAGDEVIVHAVGGTYGEEIVVPGSKVVKKPAEMSWEMAAGLPTIGITAYHLLFSLLKIRPEQTVFIQGASGGVGSMLVQLAKTAGNHVLASASSKNKGLTESFGADEFGAYDKEDIGALFHERADIVIDATKGSRSFAVGEQALKPGGKYVAMNGLPDTAQQTKPAEYYHYGPKKEYSDEEALNALVKAFEADALAIRISAVLPFELSSVITAHEMLEGHPPAGKNIIQM